MSQVNRVQSVNPFTLENKKILVTGASSGIGRQAAISIDKWGGSLVVTGRKDDKLNETYQGLSKSLDHQKVVADLENEKEIEELVEKIDMVDGLVYSAGRVKLFPAKYIGRDQIEEIFSINYYAPVLLVGKLLRKNKIRKYGSLVFISSFVSKFPTPTSTLYAGSKAALESYSKVLSAECVDQKIRSNCIAPAIVKTPIFENSGASISEDLKNNYPLGLGEANDVANLIIFLLSDASKWITGQTFLMDGGFLLNTLSKRVFS